MPRRPLHGLVVAFSFLLFPLAPRASAQYMFLDSNGDGVHTAADVLHGTGTTQVQIWLDTLHRRDGTAVVCAEDGSPIGFGSSFTVIVRANGGTISCTNPVSLQPLLTNPLQIQGSATEYHIGYFGPAQVGSGLFDLARFSTTVVSGSPSLEIVPDATTLGSFPFMTQFGSPCSGIDFDNTMKLGREWFDVDGLTFGPGGGAGAAPSIPALGPFAAGVGQFQAHDVVLTDADGDLIAAAIQGPPFLFYASRSSQAGAAEGRIHIQARRGDEGTYDPRLIASDGTNQSEQAFHLDVVPSANHSPQLRPEGRQDAVAGRVLRTRLQASDSDGDPLSFTKVSGPGYAEVATLGSGRGGGSGWLTLRPGLCDVGDGQVVIGVEDGFGRSETVVPIRVHAPDGPPENPFRTTPVSGTVSDVASGDFNEDTHQDAMVVDSFTGSVTFLAGDGAGQFQAVRSIDLGGHRGALAAGDWNHDGHLDAAAGSFDTGAMKVLYGRGDGSFATPVELAGATQCNRLTTADLNSDGIDDLVFTSIGDVNQAWVGSDQGLVLAQHLSGLNAKAATVVADLDRDGLPDVAMSGHFPDALTLMFGRGDGTLTGRRDLPMPEVQNGTVAGDWNGDGATDLASIDDETGTVRQLIGDGAGGFTVASIHQFLAEWVFNMHAIDWNGDGYDDLLFSGSTIGRSILYGRPGGGWMASPLNPHFEESVTTRFADFNEDGLPDMLGGAGSSLFLILNTTGSSPGVLGRAFTTAKVTPIAKSSRLAEIHLEPIGGVFAAQDIDLGSLRLASDGTGSSSNVPASFAKGAVIEDANHNGILELVVPFRMSDLAALFDQLQGRREVPVRVQGSLQDQRALCAPLTLSIIAAGGGSLAAQVEPNPLNPRGMLRFVLDRKSEVTIRIFDASGRIVRKVWDRRHAEAGLVEVPIDGRNASGQTLASGVYFYQIDAGGKQSNGRFAVLK